MTLDELVSAVREVCANDLVTVVLYGSAAGRDYHGAASDQNVLVIVQSADATRLTSMAPAVRKWVGSGNPPPLILTLAEWESRADVFAIEYADLIERHRVLLGTLPTERVRVRARDLRVQLESETMGKLLRFRRGLMSAAGNAERTRELLDDSLSSLLALLRATLHLHGEPIPPTSEQLCDRVAALATFSPDAFRAVLANRRGTQRLADGQLDGVVRGYLSALESLVAYVDGVQVPE
ncbi:MAG TPA: hypothetical protein VE967_12800 [Gemmatimonadaceae bacterium]|nr:hypothetical protein [Gemmatimonadaceae bacterium]